MKKWFGNENNNNKKEIKQIVKTREELKADIEALKEERKKLQELMQVAKEAYDEARGQIHDNQ